MAGTILENLSNRKLFGVLGIICLIQMTSFIIGAFITPAPSSPEQYIANQCVAENPKEFSVPRTDDGKPFNCRSPEPHEQGNITFAFQMPLPRGGVQLDYSRWMANMLTLVIPEVLYDTRISGPTKNSEDDQAINATVVLAVRLAVKNVGESKWREYYKTEALRRTITCRIEAAKRKQGINYDCDLIQLFELQSLYYDHYLINLQFVSSEKSEHFGFLSNLWMVAIHQNGGFTQVWLALKLFFTAITLATLFWYCRRLGQLTASRREATLLEKTLIALGLGITQLNLPVEYVALFLDIEFMSFLCDIRQGVFHCSLLAFWIIFIGEHLLVEDGHGVVGGGRRLGLAAYGKQLGTILAAYVSLFVFESTERGIQVVDPFYSIWEVNASFAMVCITATILFAIGYFLFLSYHLWLAFRNISTKQQSLPSMPTARRLLYKGVIYRFRFLLAFTFVCAASTVVAYIMGQVSEDQWYWDDQRSFMSSLQWSSAMFTTVFALWNCYVITLLILYAPSHKGMGGSETDEMSVEFTRLTESSDRSGSSSYTEGTARISYSTRSKRMAQSDMSLLQEIASKQNIS